MPTATHPLIATEYVSLAVTIPPLDTEKLAEFKRSLILQCQGENVEVLACPSQAAPLLFTILYEVAAEAVVCIGERKVLLFDHHARPSIRPRKVETIVWKEMRSLRKQYLPVGSLAAPRREARLDLEKIWSKSTTEADLVLRTKSFLRESLDTLEPALTLTICGSIPLLPFLAAAYCLRPYGETIYYASAEGALTML
jgi:hypothetical protein